MWHYCYNNCNMNWLMGIGLMFNALGNILSGSRRTSIYPSFGMPIFSYPTYPTYPNYTYSPIQQYQPANNNDFLVGNTLAGLSSTQTNYPLYDNSNSIFSGVFNNTGPQVQEDYNLVGNTLTSIQPSNYNSSYQYYTSLGEHSLYSNSYSPLNSSYSPSLQQPEVAVPPSHIGKNDTIIKNGEHVRISKDIEGRIKQIAAKLNCDYRDLMGLIWAESRFNKNAWNGTTAVGLIQFTQICIDDLNQNFGMNLTKQKIAQMSVFQQLDLAEKALLRAKQIAGLPQSHRMNAAELYTINFLPGRLKSHANKGYLTKRGENFYAQNKGADINKDNYITKDELSQFVQRGRQYVTTIA